jgi:polar amino acid transport system substrate-binding protein
MHLQKSGRSKPLVPQVKIEERANTMKLTKKIFVFAMVAMMIASLSLLAACGGGNSGGGTAEKTYKIATDTTFAPFEFTDKDGNFVGIDLELLDAIAKDQGFKYEINSVGFDAALQAVTSGQADAIIAGCSIRDDRKEVLDFSDPYFDSGVVMGIAADNTDIKGYEDLAGKKVAAKTGTEGLTFAESIKAEYGFEIVVFDDSAIMYADVLADNSQACFEDYPVVGYGISQGSGLKIVTEMEQGSSYGFGVKKGQNPELIEMFNAGLKNVKANGTYQAILDKYIEK